MSITIDPKSGLRRNDNIIYGYAEIPATRWKGQIAWGLPGGHKTTSREEATRMAMQINDLICKHMENIGAIQSLK